MVVTGTRASSDAITNTQVAGVDEGGIIKVAGDILVILRRGRLFTVSLTGGTMRPLASINAFPPGVNGSGDWYDEMLLSGDRVIVVGYSYARGGTEVNRFRLRKDGSLRFEDATHLKSNDYYSSRNYASRLIGTTLIYYSPLDLEFDADPLEALPALRRWRGGTRGGAWQRTTTPRRVFVPQRLRDPRNGVIDTVHSVTRCDLAAPQVACSATAVFGPESHSFFVSQNAVYVWTAEAFHHHSDRARAAARGFLYRMPLDGGRPQAVGVRGVPVDQFSFAPDPARDTLNVLVEADGDGDGMWGAEGGVDRPALARIPMTAFGSGATDLRADRYQPLPAISGWGIHNRFVGDHLLYGGGDAERVTVVGVADRRVTSVALPHKVSRIDQMGLDAILVGESEQGLGFSTVALAQRPSRADTFVLPAASEGESRSHAFFFRADVPDGSRGLVGLPVARSLMEGRRYVGRSAAMQFLRREQRRLRDAGELAARGQRGEGEADGRVASCVDWYGNARPIFWRGRVFALMGYELVEGSEADGRIRERARVDFAPGKHRR